MQDYSWIPETKPKSRLVTGWKVFLVLVLIGTAFMLNGCSSVQKTLGAVDYACVDIELDGYTTDSGLIGRGLVVPEGETLTSETIDLLCNY